jgi:hypothetical protein
MIWPGSVRMPRPSSIVSAMASAMKKVVQSA